MCTAEAGFALNVVSSIADHNAKKEQAYRTSVSNFHAKNAASAALFDDYGQIDNNKINAAINNKKISLNLFVFSKKYSRPRKKIVNPISDSTSIILGVA